MAITEAFTGSETVSTTEWSMTTDSAGLNAETSDGVFQAFIDLSNLAKGDVFRLRVYEKVLSGSTQEPVWEAFFANAQSTPVAVIPALILVNGWDMTLLLVAGSDRAIDWSIRKVA